MGTLVRLIICVFIISSTSAMHTVYMTNHCGGGKYMDFSAPLRVKTNQASPYKPAIDCKFIITTDSLIGQLMIQFTDMSIEPTSNCSSDWLTMYDGESPTDDLIGKSKFCGYSTPDTVYTTSGQSVTFYYHSDSFSSGSGFDIIITTFHTGDCFNGDISCDNGRCVDDDMRCNGYNPCGDHSDCPLAVGVVAGISLGATFFAVFIVIAIVFARRRRKIRTRVAGPALITDFLSTSTVQYGQQSSEYSQNKGYGLPVPTKYSNMPPQPPAYSTVVTSPTQPLLSNCLLQIDENVL